MTLYTWLLFLSTISLLSAIPGPNMVFVLNTRINQTLKETLISTAGCLLGVLISITACCLTLLFLSNLQTIFIKLINLFGIIYLFLIGIKHLNYNSKNLNNDKISSFKTHGNLFINGFFIAICNPKTILFIISFFPQFINRNSPLLSQYSILIFTFVICEFSWMLIYIWGGEKIKVLIKKPKFFYLFNKIIGAFFILFSISLISLNLT
ncbi:LysE family translocator [Acinetobacter calcoaceticus]|uniref:LysE family translocator n=1 Tax=Acinetobacter calcoaceticus TaxID=471 RepID=UPI003A872280